jgi:hypothetical protein
VYFTMSLKTPAGRHHRSFTGEQLISVTGL